MKKFLVRIDGIVVGIFDKKVSPQRFIEYGNYEVNELELNKLTFVVLMDKKGNFTANITTDLNKCIYGVIEPYRDMKTFYVFARDSFEAVKIADNHRIELIKKGKWV